MLLTPYLIDKPVEVSITVNTVPLTLLEVPVGVSVEVSSISLSDQRART